MTAGWESVDGQYPEPPQNGQVTSAYLVGCLDIRWDDPAILAENTPYEIVGVNIYRSDVSDRGPFHRINPYPLGGTFFRDQTENTFVSKEVVVWDGGWASKGEEANRRRWVLRTSCPIVKSQAHAPFQKPTSANSPSDVTLYVDGVEVTVADVFGPSGEVTLIDQGVFDDATEKMIPPVIPTEDSVVEISYYTNRNHVRSGLDAKLYYRITTVALDPDTPSGLIETPLNRCEPYTNIAVETLDYIWREASRRNNWILEQGGERVKAFIRKQSGIKCYCGRDERQVEYSQQPDSRCQTCFGTGIVGGYEGPYEMIIAPDDGERRIAQTQSGRRMEHTYEVWTGPSPLVTQRDFFVKQTNERYSVGAVRRPTNRGNVLQQHFTIGYLDEGDIRYQVPINGTAGLPWPESRTGRDPQVPYPVIGTQYHPQQVGSHPATPMTTEKDNIDDEREKRGRTKVWENQNY